MTKVSWKRILQRAGNDLPNHHGRAFPDGPRLQQHAPRAPRPVAEPPSLIAGELETELRRALQRSQGGGAVESDSWDPIYVAREVRHTPPAVPVSNYRELESKSRGGTAKSGARNVIAASLSAAVLGFGAYQLGIGWGGGGGGGGGNGGNGDTPSQSASVSAPLKIADQAKRIETGYAIQPMLQAGQTTDIGPAKEPASLLNPDRGQTERAATDAAAAFKRDMDEAVKLFEDQDRQQAATSEAPERPQPAARQAAPTRQAPAPTRSAALSADVDQPAASTPQARTNVASVDRGATEPKIGGAEEDQLLQRASGLMKRGDVTGARLLFEHLALRGSALGAFALAQSYDPRHLNKLVVRGLTGDQKQADYWYRRAAELGGTGATAGTR
jgi:hypothetical protein